MAGVAVAAAAAAAAIKGVVDVVVVVLFAWCECVGQCPLRIADAAAAQYG